MLHEAGIRIAIAPSAKERIDEVLAHLRRPLRAHQGHPRHQRGGHPLHQDGRLRRLQPGHDDALRQRHHGGHRQLGQGTGHRRHRRRGLTRAPAWWRACASTRCARSWMTASSPSSPASAGARRESPTTSPPTSWPWWWPRRLGAEKLFFITSRDGYAAGSFTVPRRCRSLPGGRLANFSLADLDAVLRRQSRDGRATWSSSTAPAARAPRGWSACTSWTAATKG